jgi:hypothetical protein
MCPEMNESICESTCRCLAGHLAGGAVDDQAHLYMCGRCTRDVSSNDLVYMVLYWALGASQKCPYHELQIVLRMPTSGID